MNNHISHCWRQFPLWILGICVTVSPSCLFMRPQCKCPACIGNMEIISKFKKLSLEWICGARNKTTEHQLMTSRAQPEKLRVLLTLLFVGSVDPRRCCPRVIEGNLEVPTTKIKQSASQLSLNSSCECTMLTCLSLISELKRKK